MPTSTLLSTQSNRLDRLRRYSDHALRRRSRIQANGTRVQAGSVPSHIGGYCLETSADHQLGWRPLDCSPDFEVVEDGIWPDFCHPFGFTSGYVSGAFTPTGRREMTGIRWDPYEGYTGIASNQSAITHGTFFWHASREGCISKGTSVHGGLRTKLFVSLLSAPVH